MPRQEHREPDGFAYQVRFCDIVFRVCATRAEAEEAYEAAHTAWAAGGPFDPDAVDGQMYFMSCDADVYGGSYSEHVSYSVVKVDAAGKKHKIRDEDDEEDDEDDEA